MPIPPRRTGGEAYDLAAGETKSHSPAPVRRNGEDGGYSGNTNVSLSWTSQVSLLAVGLMAL